MLTQLAIDHVNEATPLNDKLEKIVLPLYYENRNQSIWIMNNAISKIACKIKRHRKKRPNYAQA